LVDKNATLIFGPRPMITDLRTGAISGGSAEQPIATAMAGQMAQFYGFANSAISGATDSKAPDSQASFEKAANVQMAALSGVNLITQACGSLASLMATSFTASVIDNDMLGVIRRSCGKLEINKTTLGLDSIKNVVNGDGHFLGQPETYNRMRSDYLYPNISDRQNYEDWIDAGSPDIVETAKHKVSEILEKNNADHLQPDTIKSINELI
jgi:trimethylamine--corrinoid protein Co-methyltransferase